MSIYTMLRLVPSGYPVKKKKDVKKRFEHETPSLQEPRMQNDQVTRLLLFAQALEVYQLEVSASLCQKLVVSAVLNNSALVEDKDHVSLLNGR
jgi:hypothetical protein